MSVVQSIEPAARPNETTSEETVLAPAESVADLAPKSLEKSDEAGPTEPS